MAKTSVAGIARRAQQEDTRLRRSLAEKAAVATKEGKASLGAPTLDSFVNFAHKLGMGADNAMSQSSYGFNPISRNKTLLEWIHRGSWIGGLAVDVVADDMTRAGIEYTSELEPDHAEVMDKMINSLNIWGSIGETIRWGRLYGGCIAIALIDGQDMRTPLRLETVGPGDFKGLLVLDRWMLDPVTTDLVTEFGPHLGLPKYYRVLENAPACRGAAVHHSRVMFRHDGVTLPYQQKLVENMWGMSVLERLYDRMIAFDSASTGAAQLVYKAYIRTLSVAGLRDIIASGGAPLTGLTSYVDIMRRFQGIEGITVIDAEDKFETQNSTSMSGLSDILISLGQQVSGALQIPLVRLFGQSPAGLNSTGESDLRMYYDHIAQLQEKDLDQGMVKVCRMVAASKQIPLPPSFGVRFKSLWQLKDDEKANIAKTDSETVNAALEAGVISPQTALKELRQSSRTTGRFTNITKQMIDEADDQIQPPPPAEGAMPGMGGGSMDLGGSNPPAEGDADGKAGPEGQAPSLGQGADGGAPVQQQPAPGGQAGGTPRRRIST